MRSVIGLPFVIFMPCSKMNYATIEIKLMLVWVYMFR